ncbi:MAG TPA: hypothetical protein VJZ91_01845, partial [Blastocatellia bacterium]|nr:hypothetical protein [Blastocatellia bacterium]
MRRFPHQLIPLLTFALAVLVCSPSPRVSVAGAQAARQLPTEIVAEQTTPDIKINGGFEGVAGVGDFNGDGVSDFLINDLRQGVVGGQTDPFKFGIIFGKRNPAQPITIDMMKDAPDLTLTTRATDPFGLARISTFGDLNNDGIDDFVVRQFFADQPSSYRFKIFYGSPKWRPGTEDADALPADLTVVPTSSELRVTSIAGAADVNGDGVRDLLM